MAFKDTYRLEKVYYENMWTLLKSLKALKENPSADGITKVNEILDDAIACNESIIIIYKNLGELYAEVAQKYTDLLADMEAIRNDLEMWKNEINEKIDDVNNYLMGHIRDLDDRVTSLEGRVSDLEDRMTTAENDIDALEGRMDTAEGDIDALEGRMDTAEDDIDGLQGDVSDLEQNKQDKLTAGFGIDIDSNNEISIDTNDVQEKLIAGQNITLTPDTTDPTKMVIDAQGASYIAGNGINITNDVISTKLFGFTNGTELFANPHDLVLANTPSDYAKLSYSGNFIDTSRTGEQIIALLNNYDVLRFIIAITSFNVPTDYSINSVEYVVNNINMTLQDSSNASIPLFIESFDKVVGFNSKGSNTQNKFPINMFLQGTKELIEYINPTETYHFHCLITGFVKINGVELTKSATTAILTTPSVSCNLRLYA